MWWKGAEDISHLIEASTSRLFEGLIQGFSAIKSNISYWMWFTIATIIMSRPKDQTSSRQFGRKRTSLCNLKNKVRGFHKANVMTHQTVLQTALRCHTLSVISFCKTKKMFKKPKKLWVYSHVAPGYFYIDLQLLFNSRRRKPSTCLQSWSYLNVCESLATNSCTLNLTAPCGQFS